MLLALILKNYLRGLIERYVNLAAVPRSSDVWERALGSMNTYNSGFTVSWPTTGYLPFVPQGKSVSTVGPVICSFWTNGKAVRICLDHSSRYINSFDAYFAAFPKPTPATTSPLNSDAIELWDIGFWTDAEGLFVSDPTRARMAIVRVVVKPPYAPGAEADKPGVAAGVPPWWGSQLKAPLSPLQWHIEEVYALSAATRLAALPSSYPSTFAADLAKSSDRVKFLADARTKRDAYAVVVQRYTDLKFPDEASDRGTQMVAALQKGLSVWDKALAYWKPLADSFPSGTEAFFTLQGDALRSQLTALGWTADGDPLKDLDCSDLLAKYGLE